CHENAFAAFGGVSSRIMVDNLKSAVLQRLVGAAPVFNPRYLDFSRHWGFEISPCNVRSGNEKGRVENAVGYVKKNLLAGLELADFAAMQPAATHWVDTVANVRIHGATHQRPMDRFEDERAHLRPLNPAGFDLARVCTVRATKQFRVPLDTNHYSVPARYAGQMLTLKAYAERVCLYDADKLIARHPRSMDRHQDIEDPDHARELLANRKSAREQRLLVHFLALSPRAQAYREGLEPSMTGWSFRPSAPSTSPIFSPRAGASAQSRPPLSSRGVPTCSIWNCPNLICPSTTATKEPIDEHTL
ncbi:MAG: hypothetical protein B7Z74_11280, partial [Deltaproteobacteria bacterium 21-66-5]